MTQIQFINLNSGFIPNPPVLRLEPDKYTIYTNEYINKDLNTDYTKLINNPVINDDKTLFIYNANKDNTGYKGGIGGASALIGCMENTYGFLTGFLDKPKDYKGTAKEGYPSLDKISRFENYIDGVSINLASGSTITGKTTKELIDSLFTDLIKTINDKQYTRIVLPVDNTGNLGSQVFEIGNDVKKYIIDRFSQIQPHATWKHVQTLLTNEPLSDDKDKESILDKELNTQPLAYTNYVTEKRAQREANQVEEQARQERKLPTPAIDYSTPKSKSTSLPNYGWDFDGVWHASVTPLICSSRNCSRHPVNIEKKIEHKILMLNDVIHVWLHINLNPPGNHYIISSNPKIAENIKPLVERMHNNPFTGVIYAGQNKLDVLCNLNLDAFYDDSNMHLYNILDAKDREGLPKAIYKVFPEALYNIYDAKTYITNPLASRPAGTNNPYIVQISKTAKYIRVFTYNINYKITTSPNNHKDHITSIGAIINHVATDPANNADFICLQESTMSGTELGAKIFDYTELANRTGFPAGQALESQFTYYDNTKYTHEAELFGNLDGTVQAGDIFPNRPFTLVCLYSKVTFNKIILINVHFPHSSNTNAEIVAGIKHFIDTADVDIKAKILEYINNPTTRIIMAGDFNRVIKGNPEPLQKYDNSHYGLALFQGLYAGNTDPVILYNIEPTEGHFEKKEHMTCCDPAYKLKSPKYYNHGDNVLDSWGLQYKYEYPNTDYKINDLTEYASDHRPVMVTLLDGNVIEVNKADIRI